MTRLLRMPEVLAKTGLSRTRLYAAIARNDFPQPVKLLGPQTRAVGFAEDEIDRWIERRLAEREAA